LPHIAVESLPAGDVRELHSRGQTDFAISTCEIAVIRSVQNKPLRNASVYSLATQFPRHGSKTQGRSSHFSFTQTIVDCRENDQAADTQEEQDQEQLYQGKALISAPNS